MPFAGFENFDACVASQKAKGHSDKSAHKICGAIQQQAEGKISAKDLASVFAEVWVEENVTNRTSNH